jgi:hypothetical protein
MRDNKHAYFYLIIINFFFKKRFFFFFKKRFLGIAEQTCEELYLQAGHTSIYSIKPCVGKCIFGPRKQSRIRRSRFWSHRRSTVRWDTALSSKERIRRVNCPRLIHIIFIIVFLFFFFYFYILKIIVSKIHQQ